MKKGFRSRSSIKLNNGKKIGLALYGNPNLFPVFYFHGWPGSRLELKNIPIVRKSIVAKKPIKRGEQFLEDNLTVKRPGMGISPMEWDDYMGKFADREYQVDDLIQ